MPSRPRPAALGLAVALLLVALAFVLPQVFGWQVWPRAQRSVAPGEIPPLHGLWEPKWFGPGTLPAVVLAVLAVRFGPGVAERLSWGRLLLASYAVGLAWLLSLALVDGPDGLSRALGSQYEYLPSARAVTDVSTLLHTYIDRIPIDAPHHWPTHPAGHPPLALLFFVGLVRIGLGGAVAAGLVVTALAATTALAGMVTLRALGAERAARAAAPFLVLTPAAVFMAVSADAMFAAVAAWGLACLALATRSGRPVAEAGGDVRGSRYARWRSLLDQRILRWSSSPSPWATAYRDHPGSRAWLGWSILAGLLLGATVMMSYGLLLVGLIAVAVLVAGRSWRPLPVVAVVALAVVLAFAIGGFEWWRAYPVLTDRYWAGIAKDRPASYWMWGNLAALLVSAGPLIGAGVAQLAARWRDRSDPSTRVVVLLAAAALACLVVADLSRMSKAEVERIWLPFVPWLTLAVVLLPERWRRGGLALQVVWAIAVQQLVYTVW